VLRARPGGERTTAQHAKEHCHVEAGQGVHQGHAIGAYLLALHRALLSLRNLRADRLAMRADYSDLIGLIVLIDLPTRV
jgi:hypothetical protein